MSNATIPVFNPSTEEQIADVADSDQAAVDAAVARARETFDSGAWRKLPAAHRAEVLFRAADIITERADELAELESRDNGMTAIGASQIIKVSRDMLMYYAGWVGKIHGESANLVSDGLLGHYENYHTFTQLEPGIFREAGLPDGVLNVITGYGETTGAALTAHPDVDKISFTGSTEVGRLIVKAAAGNLKRLTLELGGKSPLIMFDDANLDKAIIGAGMGLLAGSGQNCSCTSRIYVQRGIYEQVVDGLAAFVKMLPMGGNDDPNSVLGPLISEKQRQCVQGIVSDGVAGGAQVVTGGKPMDRRGYFYEATIVTGTTPDMRLIREEIFGPVGCVIPFDEEDEVIAAANDTEYGLAGSIWTENLGRAHRVVNELRGGQIWVNCALGADPSMPICGHKQSGWGGEVGKKGIEEYFNTKSVYISL